MFHAVKRLKVSETNHCLRVLSAMIFQRSLRRIINLGNNLSNQEAPLKLSIKHRIHIDRSINFSVNAKNTKPVRTVDE